MAGRPTASLRRAPSHLAESLRGGGIARPRTAISEAKRAGLPLALACALLEKESSGGHNVYGHDPSIFRGRGKVTRGNYAEYKRLRVASRNRSMQGVGPCQLTWWELQDAADAQGGCWRPEINMRVGFAHLAGLVARYGDADGARRYNGSGAAAEAYSRDLLAKARKWQAVIGAARREGDAGGREKVARRRPDRATPPAPRPHRNGSAQRATAPTLEALTAELRRRDEEADQAWRRLVVHAHRRRRALLARGAALEARATGGDDDGVRELLAALTRIEGRLETLVEVTEHKRANGTGEPAPAPPPVGSVAASAVAAPRPSGGSKRPLRERAVPELLREVEAAERRRRRLREELLVRYAQVERELGAARQHAPARKQAPARRDERGPRGGGSATTKLGDSGRFVRRSKVALARYLADRDGGDAALRRGLRREAATPRIAEVASPTWARAVEAAQRVAGRPVNGELDGELVRLLLPYWPRDRVVKRAVRRTPAWRAIPGQLTPNFNLKELACKDRANTPYVQGLMREQGLSRKQARARAKSLAERLERVRRLGGGRPLVVNSAYRTRAYNASLGGSATNSSHTRGFAADISPPRGVTLEQHRQHVLEAFECGVGFYPMGRGFFVHGDFDHTLGGRRVW